MSGLISSAIVIATEIGADIAAVGAAIDTGIMSGIGALGLGTEAGTFGAALGGGIEGIGMGAALGAGGSAITGGDPLKGAEFGAITGGITGGVGPALGSALGSTTAGDALSGAAGGALGGVATGGNPLTSALMGGASGAIAGSLSSDSNISGTTGGTTTSPSSGGATSVTSAPAGVAGGGDTLSSLQTYSRPSDFPGGAVDGGAGGMTPVGSPSIGDANPMATGGSESFTFGGAPSPASQGISQALGQSTTIGSAKTPDFSDFSGGTSPGGSSATQSFMAGTPNTGATNVGQGPTMSNAASLSGAAAPKTNSITDAYNDPSFSNIGKALSSNAGILTSLGGLGVDAITGSQVPKGEKQLLQNASQLQSLGNTNMGYLNSGTLPAGAQAGINQATQAAIAAIKSRYASMGMSGSSSEQEEIANARTTAQVQGTNIAMQLMQQGASEVGMSSEIYTNIMKGVMASDQEYASAFTNLASAVGGGTGGGATIKIGGGV